MLPCLTIGHSNAMFCVVGALANASVAAFGGACWPIIGAGVAGFLRRKHERKAPSDHLFFLPSSFQVTKFSATSLKRDLWVKVCRHLGRKINMHHAMQMPRCQDANDAPRR